MKKIYLLCAITVFVLNTNAQQIKPAVKYPIPNHSNPIKEKFNYPAQNNTALKQMEVQGMGAIGNWLPVGPFNTQQGIGRVNCISFIDADTWLVGTAGGGLWKTDVAGIYNPQLPGFDKPWTPLTDKTTATGVSGIAVKPSAPNKIYILTGDGDRKYTSNNGIFIYEDNSSPSTGILKTTDGGTTWNETSLKFESNEMVFPHKLLMHPTNANKMYAAASIGLYITSDGWATKSLRLAGENVFDVEIHPTNSNIIYISTDTAIYLSTDGLASEPLNITNRIVGNFTFGIPSRTSLAVSAAAPNNLYFAAGNDNWGLEGIYISTNSAASFTAMYNGANGTNLLGSEGTFYKYGYGSPQYNLAFAADPANPNKLMIGGIDMYVSYSQGLLWSQATDEKSTSSNYVHKSIHTIEFNPYSGAIICGTEGGIYSSPGNNDTYWEKRWAGMQIAQYNYFDVNNSSSYFATEIIGGAMDNGIDANGLAATLSSGNSFSPVDFDKVGNESGYYCFSGTADGTEYRYTEDGTGHLFLQAKVGLGGGWTTTDISPDIVYDFYDEPEGPAGNFGIPIAVNPNEFQSILADYTIYDDNNSTIGDLAFSNDFGNNWTGIPVPLDDMYIDADHIAWNKNNGNNVAYSGSNTKIVVTNQLYGGLISGNYNWKIYRMDSLIDYTTPISDIAFTDDPYPNNIVFTAGEYKDSIKVFRLMKDSTWKNISYNLPNTRMRCITTDENGIYAGTDIGVFFLAEKDSVWSYFSKGLPTAPVTRIKVVQDILGRRVYCSTFGRGIWKSAPAPAKRITRYYVNKVAVGANTGLSWTDAFTKVQDAINKAIPGDSIWVAKGTYYPTSTYAISGGSGSRLYTFIIDSNTVMYGGFYGDETRLEQRNTTLYETKLSGNLGDTTLAADNAYHVLTILNSTKNSFIDGFTIRDGRADGSFTSNIALQKGAAARLVYDSLNVGRPFFKNCIFSNNLAAGGGAIYISQNFRSDARTSFLKCTFRQNSSFDNASGNRGGAMILESRLSSTGAFKSLAVVIDSCVFDGNTSYNGAAIYNDASSNGYIKYTINQTQFLHNKSSGYGGAISNTTSNKGKLFLYLNDCTFLDDDATTAGGAIYAGGSSSLNDDNHNVYVNNCSFDSCSGYAMYASGGKVKLEVDKSVFVNNSGGIQHVGATADSFSRGIITRCTFTNTSTGIFLNAGNSGTGLTNRSVNYSIDSCTFTNNSYGLYVSNYSQGQNAKQVQYTLSNSALTNNISGAVYNSGSDNCNITATLKKNSFTNNKGTNGGAVYSNGYQNGSLKLFIDSCDFTGNRATGNGGALYNYHLDVVSVSNCNFLNDSAASGGAVYNFGQYKNALYKFDFNRNSFTNNVASSSGGALLFSNTGVTGMNINVIRNTFTGNTAANYGGSLYASSGSLSDTVTLRIDSCTFNTSTTTLNTTQSHGGAIYLYASNMIADISNTDITNCKAKARGGAIYAEKTNASNKLALTLTNCNMQSNSSDAYGGGLVVTSYGNTDLSIDSCLISSNSAVSGIGGMYIYSNGPLFNANFNHTTFDGNTTPLSSGALQINADGKISGSAVNCIFKNNTATTTGGAVRLYAYANDLNDFDFKNCLFNNNTAGDNGGAAYIQTDISGKLSNAFDNCVLTNNKALRGGALYITASNSGANISVPLTNCTIANNNATVETGGIFVTRTSTPIVRTDLVNNILWNNTDAAVTANKKQAFVSGGAAGYVKNSIIKDSIPSGFADSTGNVFSDPLFINANDVDGADNIFATADDGFSIGNTSPAKNTGLTVAAITTDITGLARPQGNAYDIGAYERPGCSVANVTGLALTKATSCSLQYSWNAVVNATSYEASYKLNASGTWISLGDIGNVLTKTITGLTANTTYDFRVRTKAGNCTGNWASLSNKQTDLYNEPENPTETNITATSAKLQWQAPACGTLPVNYTVQGKPASSGSWVTFTTPNRSFNATGLIANTPYIWKVRANYSGGNSLFTAPRNFTTLASAIVNPSDENMNAALANPANAALMQNIPNPFAGSTIITYSLPTQYQSAHLIIVNSAGIIIEYHKLNGHGKGNITFTKNFPASGSYSYSLYVDGKLIGTRQMILAK